MAKRVKILGAKELERTLESLSDDLRNKDMAYATRKGAQEVADRAKVLAPVDTGRLRRNIVVRKDKRTVFDSEYFVGIRRSGKADSPNNAFYGYFVHEGHDARPPKTRGNLFKRKHRRGQSGRHYSGVPFMDMAWKQKRQDAERTFRERINRRMRTRKDQIKKGKL